MFDFAWSELALIAVIALVVIGPKDLPRVMRMVGQWVQRARAIAREFQNSLDQMVRESELDEMKRNFDRAASLDVEREIQEAIDPGGHIHRSLSDPVLANPLIEQAKPETPTEIAAPPAIEEKSPAAIEEASPEPAALPVAESEAPAKREGEGPEPRP